LSRVAALLSGELELAEVLSVVADVLAGQTGHSRVFVAFWEPESQTLDLAIGVQQSPFPGVERLPASRFSPTLRAALETRTPKIADYDAEDSGFGGTDEKTCSRLALLAPITYRGELLGVVFIDDPGERKQFSAGEIEFVDAVVSQAAAAIELSRTLEESRESARLAQALGTVDGLVHSSLDFAEILRRALQEGGSALGADTGAIAGSEAGGWTTWESWGFEPGIAGLTMSEEENSHGRMALDSGSPVVVSDVASDPRVPREFLERYSVGAVIGAPVKLGGRPVAVLYFNFRRPHRFTDSEIRFAENLASSLSIALENARRFDLERTRLRRAQAINEVLRIAATAEKPEQAARACVEYLTGQLGVDAVTLWAVDPDSQRLAPLAISGMPEKFFEDFSAGIGLEEPYSVAMAYKGDRAYVYGSGAVASVPSAVRDYYSRYGFDLSALIALPLRGISSLLGAVTLAWTTAQEFGDIDIEFYSSISRAMALAVDSARLFECERERTNRVQALHDITEAAISSLETQEVASRAFAHLKRHAGVDYVHVYTIDDAGETLRFLAGEGGTASFYERVGRGISLDEPLEIVPVFQTGEMLLVSDATQPDAVPEAHELYRRSGMDLGAYLLLPLVSHGERLGVLVAAWRSPRNLSADDTDFFGSVANELAGALRNARLFQSVRQYSEQVSDLLTSMHDGFASIDRDWRYTLVNPRAEQIIGRPAEELVGKSMRELFPEMHGWPHYERVMAERVPEHFEVWSLPLQAWLEIRVYPTSNGIAIVFTDITERKNSELELEQARRRADMLSMMLDDSSQPFMAASCDGRFLMVNPAFEELTGYSAEELAGMRWPEDVTSPETVSAEYGAMEQLQAGGPPQRFEKEFLCKDGSTVPAEILRHAHRDEDDAIDYYYAFITDISERKASAQALKRSEAEARSLIEYAPAAIFKVSVDGQKFLWMNDVACQWSGYQRAELMALRPLDLANEDSGRLLLTRFQRAILGEEVDRSVELTIVTKNGEERRMIANIGQFGYDAQGEPESALVVMHDITEREKTQAELQRRMAVNEAVNRILDAALHVRSDLELGNLCLEVASEVTGAPHGFIAELADGELAHIAVSELGWDACSMRDRNGQRIMPSHFKVRGLYGAVADSGESLVTNYPSWHSASIGTPEGHPRIQSFLGVPLQSGGRTVGVLAVANKPSGFTDADRQALESIAPAINESLTRTRAERALAEAKQLLDAQIDNSPLAVVEFDSKFRVIRWSHEAERLFGWTAEEVMGEGMRDIPWIYEEDQAAVEAESERLFAGVGRSVNVNRNRRKDGSVIWCEWYDSALYDAEGKMVSILSQILDVTERRAAQESMQESESRLRAIVEAMPMGVALVDKSAGLIESNEAYRQMLGEIVPGGPSDKPPLLAFPMFDPDTGRALAEDERPTARAIRGGEPVLDALVELDQLKGPRRTNRVNVTPLKDEQGDVDAAVVVIQNVTEQRERERLEAALNEISAAIMGTLDSDEVLSRLVALSRDALRVDSASLTLRERTGWAIREYVPASAAPIAPVLADPQLERVLLEAETHVPIAINDVETDPRVSAKAMRRLRIRSLLIVPVVVQHEAVGALVFHNREAILGFGEVSVEFAERLMAIATLALENARLYEREHRIADTLQQAILTPLEEVPGLRSAVLYRPASASANVGGDFYDLFRLDDGRVALVVGDVSGKGLEAARLTSLLHDSIRAYAYEDSDPWSVFTRVNRLVYRLSPPDMFATAFYGVLDPETGEMQYCCAGHPRPAIMSHGGAHMLEGYGAPLVGAFSDAQFQCHNATLERGQTLVLYTDGIVEARIDGALFGEERLVETLTKLRHTSVERLPERLVAAAVRFAGGRLVDDTVVVSVSLVPQK
jgi:PAS domain S-box-containing protein